MLYVYGPFRSVNQGLLYPFVRNMTLLDQLNGIKGANFNAKIWLFQVRPRKYANFYSVILGFLTHLFGGKHTRINFRPRMMMMMMLLVDTIGESLPVRMVLARENDQTTDQIDCFNPQKRQIWLHHDVFTTNEG